VLERQKNCRSNQKKKKKKKKKRNSMTAVNELAFYPSQKEKKGRKKERKRWLEEFDTLRSKAC